MQATFKGRDIIVTRLIATDIAQIVSCYALHVYCNSSIYFYRDSHLNYYYTMNAGDTELNYCGGIEDVECILRELGYELL